MEAHEKNKMAKQIEFIQNGTVIDHIKAGEALKVLEILKLVEHIQKGRCKVMIGCNFESARIGVKDIIKISNGYLTQRELNQISLLAPNASISVIRNYKIVDKYQLSIEEEIQNVIACNNAGCITNHESMPTRFYNLNSDLLEFQCHYCEMIIEKENIQFV